MKTVFQVLLLGSALTLSACATEVRPDMKAQSFAQADINQDQRLTYGEYQNYLDRQISHGDFDAQKLGSYEQTNRPKAILLKFQGLDQNRDTFVTRDELGF